MDAESLGSMEGKMEREECSSKTLENPPSTPLNSKSPGPLCSFPFASLPSTYLQSNVDESVVDRFGVPSLSSRRRILEFDDDDDDDSVVRNFDADDERSTHPSSQFGKIDSSRPRDDDMCDSRRWPPDPYEAREHSPFYRGKQYGPLGNGDSRSDSEKEESQQLRPALVGAGFANLGLTCFVNVILQCITHTVPLVQRLLSCDKMPKCGRYDGFCVFCTVRYYVAQSLECDIIHPYTLVNNLGFNWNSLPKGSTKCKKLKVYWIEKKNFGPCLSPCIKRLKDLFSWYQQDDAHEFLQLFLDKLDTCWSNHQNDAMNVPQKNNDLVKQIFGGHTVSQIRCCNCDHKSCTYEPLINLSLEIENVDSLESALESFTKVEKLEDSEPKYSCEACMEHVSIEKQLKLDAVPSVAVFHLKRFKVDGTSVLKMEKTVTFPLELDLEPYTVAADAGNSELKFDLYAFVAHIGGSPHSGHYLCFIRSGPNNWFKFDDSKVSPIPEAEALSEDAYILFYTKKGTPWPCSLFAASKKCSKLKISDTSPKSVLSDLNNSSIASPSDSNLEVQKVSPGQDRAEGLSVEARVYTPDSVGLDNCNALDRSRQENTQSTLEGNGNAITPFCTEESSYDAKINEVGASSAMVDEPHSFELTTEWPCSPLEGKTHLEAKNSAHDVKKVDQLPNSIDGKNEVGDNVGPTSVLEASEPVWLPKDSSEAAFKTQRNHLQRGTERLAKQAMDRSKLDMKRKEATRSMRGMPAHRRCVLQAAMIRPSPKKGSKKRKSCALSSSYGLEASKKSAVSKKLML